MFKCSAKKRHDIFVSKFKGFYRELSNKFKCSAKKGYGTFYLSARLKHLREQSNIFMLSKNIIVPALAKFSNFDE